MTFGSGSESVASLGQYCIWPFGLHYGRVLVRAFGSTGRQNGMLLVPSRRRIKVYGHPSRAPNLAKQYIVDNTIKQGCVHPRTDREASPHRIPLSR